MARCNLTFTGRVLFGLNHGSGFYDNLPLYLRYSTDAEWNPDGGFVAIGSEHYDKYGLQIFKIEETGETVILIG